MHGGRVMRRDVCRVRNVCMPAPTASRVPPAAMAAVTAAASHGERTISDRNQSDSQNACQQNLFHRPSPYRMVPAVAR
jgi:hypothetical protein